RTTATVSATLEKQDGTSMRCRLFTSRSNAGLLYPHGHGFRHTRNRYGKRDLASSGRGYPDDPGMAHVTRARNSSVRERTAIGCERDGEARNAVSVLVSNPDLQ